MSDAFILSQGRLPLLISMPHQGIKLTEAVAQGLVAAAKSLPDTDWHLPQLYHFAHELGASTIAAQYSRYVIDLNRPADDKPLYSTATTGLFPETLFDGQPLFKAHMTPAPEERARYLEQIWQPYHQALSAELQRLKREFGYALLFEAHSIRSQIPYLFEGTLPDFNLGTHAGASCHPELAARLVAICETAPAYSYVLNGRFKGGFITREYGQPAQNIHAVQLELGQRTYMAETPPFAFDDHKARPTQHVIRQMLEAMLSWGQAYYQ